MEAVSKRTNKTKRLALSVLRSAFVIFKFLKRNGMLERAIPSTGENLPVIGLGTWQQFDVDSTSAAQGPLPEVLKRMLEKGGRLIDSSPMYGKAEERVG